MEDSKCEWDKDCPNKAMKELSQENYSKPPILVDSFAAGKAPPPMPQIKYIKVCEAHFKEANISFFKGKGGWIKSLDKNQKEFNPYGLKQCPLCQTTYQDWSLSYCIHDGSLLE